MMTKNEIRKSMKQFIERLGVKGAYVHMVVENAKVIKPQFNLSFQTEKDIFYLIQISHGITVKGIKDANMTQYFKEVFYQDNVIHDEIYDESVKNIMKHIRS